MVLYEEPESSVTLIYELILLLVKLVADIWDCTPLSAMKIQLMSQTSHASPYERLPYEVPEHPWLFGGITLQDWS